MQLDLLSSYCIMQNLKFDGAFNVILADDIKLHTYLNTVSPPLDVYL